MMQAVAKMKAFNESALPGGRALAGVYTEALVDTVEWNKNIGENVWAFVLSLDCLHNDVCRDGFNRQYDNFTAHFGDGKAIIGVDYKNRTAPFFALPPPAPPAPVAGGGEAPATLESAGVPGWKCVDNDLTCCASDKLPKLDLCGGPKGPWRNCALSCGAVCGCTQPLGDSNATEVLV